MRNEVCVIEVKNKSIRLLIGYILDNQVKIVYQKKQSLSVSLNSADVLDVGSLSKDLLDIIKIDDKKLGFKYLVKEAILVIPSFGLEVYSNSQRTTTISNVGLIEPIDIKNVYSIISNMKIPNENSKTVNIIPNYFMIYDKSPSGIKKTINAPIGLTSSYVALSANVYTLPKKFVSDLYLAFRNANIEIKKTFVSSLCSSTALANNNFKYDTYVMVQIGSTNTIVTLVNEKKVTASTYFSTGGDDLTRLIADEFKISFKEAEVLKNTYGLETSNRTYNPKLVGSNNLSKTVCNRMTLNAVIQRYYQDMTSKLTNAIKILLDEYDGFVNQIPLVMFGNTLKLRGLKEAIMRTFVNNTIEFPKSNVVGATFSDYINEIGAIYLDRDLERIFQEEGKPTNRNNSLLTREGN